MRREYRYYVVNILQGFSYAEIRNIAVETMEAVLQALEAMTVATFGRASGETECDSLRVKLALILIGCPYLNRYIVVLLCTS